MRGEIMSQKRKERRDYRRSVNIAFDASQYITNVIEVKSYFLRVVSADGRFWDGFWKVVENVVSLRPGLRLC
jgi:hypothetical protein